MQFIDLKTQYARLKSDIDARIAGVLDASLPMHPYLSHDGIDQVSAALLSATTARF